MPKSKPKGQKHIHRIVRVLGGRSYVYKCADPDCAYLVHHAQLYHLIGKLSRCLSCGNPFPLTEDALQLEIPMCDSCVNPGIDEYIHQEAPVTELTKYLDTLKENAKPH